MTTERQHTLVGCATCGKGCRPRDMVPSGDDWLCTQCAGAEIGRLRDDRRNLIAWLEQEYHKCYERQDDFDGADRAKLYGRAVGYRTTLHYLDGEPDTHPIDYHVTRPRAALGKEQP